MSKILYSLFILFVPLLFESSVEAETVYTAKWETNNEFPFYYTRSVITGEHGLIIEGSQTGIRTNRPVNYALVIDRFGTDRLISYQKVYGNTKFKIKLNAPKESKCKIRIFAYGGSRFPKGTIKFSPY